MNIWHSRYQLYPKGFLNSKSKVRFRVGALLRFRFENETVGYADLCPFQEMGDRPLEHELRGLARGRPEGLSERAHFYAELDAKARAKKESLYQPKIKIKNHFLIHQLTQFDFERIPTIEKMGYTEFKFKVGWDLQNETEALKKFCMLCADESFVRLDFNSALTEDAFTDWFEKHQSWLRPRLDFIEDPFAYEGAAWSKISKKFNIRFALDQAADPLDVNADGADVLVIKPTRQEDKKIISKFEKSSKKFVYTHSMDFPLGQMSAFYSAQQIFEKLGSRLLSCGLQHHDIYEGYTFQNEIRNDGPMIIPPEGFGFGFDHLLKEIEWLEVQ